MERLDDKVAVVTGGANGIGAGIGRALAQAGAHVVVADVDRSAAEITAGELGRIGVRTLAVECDVRERAAVEALAEHSWQAFGRVDVMVNNAGVLPPVGRLVDLAEQEVRRVLDVNVVGVWQGCSVFGRRFIEQGTPAHILNTGSENSLGIPHTGAAAYTASKHAVLGLSDVLRRELPEFIGVSVLCPGMVATRLGSAEPNPVLAAGMDADAVGRRAVEGILRGDFYILTHPPVVELARERWEELSTAFGVQAPRFPGDEELDTREILRRNRQARRNR
ncbi:NADP-dependent 3-hydroxy acid dehydrogenase YdfG [Actinocorallia herbida]|uniref:NADP-dependent 3-hydroxy acid dehydrogenase YdfG n=1 Tax=Actinocorallia herbida TaxID=58109 RepID=A0A3N1D353_9ACTN|nr:SDR family oxidoreductase [Actinocorallia herbida]ROO87949.1 NADP-dependent 3-hydroxy acid dehydrogenase YdfG [Actinocorallia herbida]